MNVNNENNKENSEDPKKNRLLSRIEQVEDKITKDYLDPSIHHPRRESRRLAHRYVIAYRAYHEYVIDQQIREEIRTNYDLSIMDEITILNALQGILEDADNNKNWNTMRKLLLDDSQRAIESSYEIPGSRIFDKDANDFGKAMANLSEQL